MSLLSMIVYLQELKDRNKCLCSCKLKRNVDRNRDCNRYVPFTKTDTRYIRKKILVKYPVIHIHNFSIYR